MIYCGSRERGWIPMPWKLKTTDDGNAVLKDGLPLFVDDNGSENAIDPNQLHGKILDLNSESKKRREENKALREKLTLFEGVEDLAAYRQQADEAIKTVQNLKDKDLVKAGEVDKLKSDMKLGFEDQMKKLKEQFGQRENELNTHLSAKDAAIRKLMVSNRFATSSLFSGEEPKTTLPPDIAETYFGRYFEVKAENGNLQLLAKDDSGEVIMSRQRLGDPADFEEAIQMIFDKYPGRDKLLRTPPGGSGGAGGQSGLTQTTPLAKLQAAHKQAVKDGDMIRQISLRTRIHEMEKKQGR